MSGTAPSPAIPIAVKHNVFEMMDATAPLNPPPSRHPEQVQLFLDRSVLEVFVNGEICATKVIKPLDGKISLNLSATGPGRAKADLVEAWPLRSIWE
jgi:sucrose-6-phosphate hydrolase SacC (GH32 family)